MPLTHADDARTVLLLDIATRLGNRVHDAYAEADKAAMDDRGGPYRPESDASAAATVRATRAAELAELAAVKERRRIRDRNVGLIVGAVFVAIIVLAVLSKAN